jgi:His-Xaa-Ser system radical SAM maturase HxsC
MIPLSVYGRAEEIGEPALGRVTFEGTDTSVRGDHVYALRSLHSGLDVEGYAGLLVQQPTPPCGVPLVHTVSIDHLEGGDVVSLDSKGYVRTLYRRASEHNAIFATDRCNSLCLMCSQPPKNIDDQWRVRQHLRLIDLMDVDTKELGITGGEPTLLKDGLIEIVAKCKERLPQTALHILSNGRLFYYRSFAEKLAAVAHPDLMIGVPIYSDLDHEHDHVVQVKGAFDETLIGLHNLGALGVPVEIRVVVHSLTANRLPQIAEYLYRNLTFASHVTFMGLELMGFAVPNLDMLWVDPWDYRHKLTEATLFLAARGVPVSVYNHQLCTVPEVIWPHCRKSISDWKNEYLSVCDECAVREACGGFFSSVVNRRHSVHIRAIAAPLTP